MLACAVCGEPNPERARFCLGCGTPIKRDEAPPPETRKTVTVVFSDLAGSTSLGERLDPESLSRLMARWFERTRAVLERHGGTVQKFIGDAVMAVFGIPTVREEDALRAVRAAAELRVALAGLNQELAGEWGETLRLRTGVNTGEVLAGDPAVGEALVLGDAVNVAARLEQAAQPDEILLGETTWRLVRDAVTVTPLPPLTLKGKGARVAAYRLDSVNPVAPGRARRLDRPMVGRERERTLLRLAASSAAQHRACHLVTVLGPAGVGKTRLVAELLAELEGSARVLSGRCLPYGEGITFWPVAEVVRQAAGMAETDQPAEARAKLRALLEDGPEAGAVADRIAQLLGLEDTAGPVSDAAWAVRKLLEALARERLLVLVLDDLHWAEPTLLDVVEQITHWSRDAPIMLLCVARPELLEQRATWGGGKLRATSVLLEPLAEEESSRLLDNLLGDAALDDAARARITELSGGNPLYLEELLAMLVDAGHLQRDDHVWRLPAGEPISMPPTIQALLAARLDRLAGGDRGVLERASVVGQVFEQAAVEELSPPEVRPGVPARLLELTRKQLLSAAVSALASEAFQFRHILIRDAAYEAMPKRRRAELHERFAVWLQATLGQRAAEYAEIIGYHYEQAVRLWTELGPRGEHAVELGVLAADQLGAGGGRAVARGDMRAAVNLLSRADSLYPQGDPRRLALLPTLARALRDLGEFDRADEAIDRAERGAQASGDRSIRAEVLLARAWVSYSRSLEGWNTYAERQAEAAIALYEELGDERGMARAWRLLAEVAWTRCQVAASEAAQLRAIEHARRAGDHVEEAANYGVLAGSAIYGPLPVEEGIRRCEEVLARFGDDPTVRARATRALAILRAMHGERDESRELIATARDMFADLGQMYWLATTAESSGIVELLAGDLAAAERELRKGVELLDGMGERAYLSTMSTILADVLEQAGDDAEAERFARIGEHASDPDDLDSQARWRAIQARLLAKRGRLQAAETLATEAVRLVEPVDVLGLQAECRLALGVVLRAAGRTAEARPAFAQALDLLDRKGNLALARRVRAELQVF
ncbi:MAG TPA: adenylate/guanylate cyclase domain-containing protein [Actinomycetota bacterium]|nr:adenylate/guanylate cyclase domain-containing protein [Actinomycetota bacterium]